METNSTHGILTVETMIQQEVAEQLNLELKEVPLSASFVSLGADSLDVAAIVMELESTFSIQIPRDHLRKILTLQDVADYVHKSGQTI